MPSGANRKARKAEHAAVRRSSGNVFEDLRVPESAQAQARGELAGRIVAIVAERGLTQAEAARLLGIDQPGVSDLVRGKLARFSSERLFRFLCALGQDIEIHVRPTPGRGAIPRIRVVAEKRAARAVGKRGLSARARGPRKTS